jgi:oligopeptide transport system permease protein
MATAQNNLGYMPVDHVWRRAAANPRIIIGGGMLVIVVLLCFGTTIWTLLTEGSHPLNYDNQLVSSSEQPPARTTLYQLRVRIPDQGQQKRALTPTGMTATLTTPGSVELGWVDSYSAESGFVLERRHPNPASPWITVATLAPNSTSHVDRLTDKQLADVRAESASRREAAFVYRLRATGESDLRAWFGTDKQGRSILARCLLGGTISLLVGAAAAVISVLLGVTVGLLAGFRGGWVDALLMRFVDIMYGLPYVLQVILFKVALEPTLEDWFGGNQRASNIVVLFVAIGLVSWLTMARVVRGQVLSLRSQPFIEACKAAGLPEWRIFLKHLLPNLIGPITVYATLTVPQAVLQESFLSFLGIGISPPMPSWGNLAADGLEGAFLTPSVWWQLLFPCILLALTLLSLNYFGDGLRDIFDPKREAAKL